MATLSACRLSRTLPQMKLFNVSTASSLCFRPDVGHEYLSRELYGSALRQMSWWSRKELDSYPTMVLAVLVLFCYLESSMGNFKEFQVHSEAVEKLQSSHSDLSAGADLLAAWVEVKLQNWWRRAHFSVLNFYRDWSIPLLDSIFKTTSTTYGYQRASVLWILCESHRLSTAVLIACYETRYDAQLMVLGEVSPPESATNITTEHELSKNRLTTMMRAQSGRLDEWYASLRDHELPVITKVQSLRKAVDTLKPEDAVITFESHDLTINFAYYATARVMQCAQPWQSLGNDSRDDLDDPQHNEREIWIQMLLRIAAGVDWNDCVRLNVYTIGLAGLLLACALRSCKLATGVWIQKWLQDRSSGGGFEEGNFPISQILEALQVINHERSHGRDLISLFQTVDDEGGSGKFGSYSSQRIQSFLVYARCHETGDLYSYQVSPGDLGSQSEPYRHFGHSYE